MRADNTALKKNPNNRNQLEDITGFMVSMNNRDFWKSNLASEQTTVDGKLQRIYNDGRKEITFPNGSIKEILKNGHTIVKFPNGDKKEDYPDGKVVYYF